MASRSFGSVVLGQAFIDTILANFKAPNVAKLVDAAFVRLSKDPAFNPTSASLVADLELAEADFSGYAAGGYALVLGAAINAGGGGRACAGNIVAIAGAANPFIQNTVYGWWVDDGANMIAGQAFGDGNQVAFGKPGDFLDMLAGIPLNFLQPAA